MKSGLSSAICELAQLALVGHALGDVDAGGVVAAHAAVLAQVGHQLRVHAPGHALQRLVILEILRLPAQHGRHARLDVGVAAATGELGAGAADDLLALEPVAPAVRFVDEAVARVGVEAGDAHRQVVGDLAQEAFAVGQALLEQLAFGHVLQRAHDAPRLAALQFQAADRAHPDAAVAGGQARQLEIPRRAALDARVHRLAQRLACLGGIAGQVVVARGHVAFVDLQDAADLVRPGDLPAAQVELPAADAGHLAGAVQEGLAGAQRPFGALALGDVAADRVQQGAFGLLAALVGPRDPAFGAVRPHVAVLALALAPGAHHAGHLLAHRLALGRLDEIVQAGADELRRRAAEGPRVRRVDVDQRAVLARQRHQFALVLHQRAMALLARAERRLETGPRAARAQREGQRQHDEHGQRRHGRQQHALDAGGAGGHARVDRVVGAANRFAHVAHGAARAGGVVTALVAGQQRERLCVLASGLQSHAFGEPGQLVGDGQARVGRGAVGAGLQAVHQRGHAVDRLAPRRAPGGVAGHQVGPLRGFGVHQRQQHAIELARLRRQRGLALRVLAVALRLRGKRERRRGQARQAGEQGGERDAQPDAALHARRIPHLSGWHDVAFRSSWNRLPVAFSVGHAGARGRAGRSAAAAQFTAWM